MTNRNFAFLILYMIGLTIVVCAYEMGGKSIHDPVQPLTNTDFKGPITQEKDK